MQDVILFENLIEKHTIENWKKYLTENLKMTRSGNSGSDNEMGIMHYACNQNRFPDHVSDSIIDIYNFLCDTLEPRCDLKFNREHMTQCVFNSYSYGEYSGVHQDNSNWTFIVYLNTEWKIDWGGATELYTEDRKRIRYSALPLGGDVLLFKSEIPHRSLVPERICTRDKFSLTFQCLTL